MERSVTNLPYYLKQIWRDTHSYSNIDNDELTQSDSTYVMVNKTYVTSRVYTIFRVSKAVCQLIKSDKESVIHRQKLS